MDSLSHIPKVASSIQALNVMHTYIQYIRHAHCSGYIPLQVHADHAAQFDLDLVIYQDKLL